MVIKASAAVEIRQLIAALGRDDEVAREAAVARLAILGDRAVDRLVAAFTTADRPTRIGILRALEAGADDRALPIARAALDEGGEVAVAGTAVLRGLLDSPSAGTAGAALDALMATVLSGTAEHRLRRAAAEALAAVPGLREQITAALGTSGAI
jgi:HEAT repeat protein